jgi:hypothetical protein
MTEYLQQVLIFYNVYVSSTFYFPYLVTKDMDVYDVHKNLSSDVITFQNEYYCRKACKFYTGLI